MPGVLQPLDQNLTIVGPDGKPTLYFIKWAQQRQIDIGDSITLAQAQALIDAWAAARDVSAGTGLSGGGNLSSDVTLSLNAGLDNLNDVDLTTPPSDGEALVYDSGTSQWIPGSVAGGLDVQEEGSSVVNPATALNFIGSSVTVTDGGGGVADITITGGGGGSSNGGYFAGGTGEFGSVSMSLYATKGAYYTPNANVTINAIECVIDAASTSQNHYAQIATVNPSTGQIGAVVATSSTVASTSTNPNYFTFEFSTPVSLTSGTDYVLLVVLAAGTGTTTLRIYAANGEFFKMNAPGESPVGGPQYNTIGVSASQSASAVASTGYAIWPVGYVPLSANAFSGARAKKTTTQVIGSTATALTWDAEDFDTNSYHDNSTNNSRITIPSGVSYVELTAAVASTSGSENDYSIWIVKNGSTTYPGIVAEGVRSLNDARKGLVITSGPLAVTAGDYFEVYMQNFSNETIIVAGSFFAVKSLGS